jgi:hypothetical protein
MLVAQSKHALCSMRQEMLDYTGLQSRARRQCKFAAVPRAVAGIA